MSVSPANSFCPLPEALQPTCTRQKCVPTIFLIPRLTPEPHPPASQNAFLPMADALSVEYHARLYTQVHPRIKRREKSNLPYLIYSFWLALDDAINQESDSMLVAALHRSGLESWDQP